LNQIPIYKNNIKGTTFLTYTQLENMKFTQFWDKVEYLFILLVGGAIKLLKTQLKLQSSPIVGTGTQPL
jgi:hypothetical protein